VLIWSKPSPTSLNAATTASRGAYRYHRIFLQQLQSGVSGQWLLKSPARLWQLDSLVAEYPDAVIVQTRRDPLNVISSITALTHHLCRLAADDSDIGECARQSCRRSSSVSSGR
jgi:hypothetical protein